MAERKVRATDATGKRKRTVPIKGESALRLADQVTTVMGWLSDGRRPFEIRTMGSEQWGLDPRTMDDRIALARKQLLKDISAADRQEIAAQVMHGFSRIALESLETRQLSNAIGALRAYAEVAGVMGRSAQ